MKYGCEAGYYDSPSEPKASTRLKNRSRTSLSRYGRASSLRARVKQHSVGDLEIGRHCVRSTAAKYDSRYGDQTKYLCITVGLQTAVQETRHGLASGPQTAAARRLLADVVCSARLTRVGTATWDARTKALRCLSLETVFAF